MSAAEPSARLITGTSSIMLAPMRSPRTLATPRAAVAMRSARVTRAT